MSIKEEIPVSVASVLAVRCEEDAIADDNLIPTVSAMEFGPQALIGRRLNNRYVLESVLGSGGTAWVFKARDLRKVEVCSSQPYVAIKILNVDLQNHPEARVGLEREAARAQQLSHPNVVSVYDFDRDGTLFYLVMEWLSGPTLDQYIQQLGQKERRSHRVKALISALISGLRFAHEQGVVHADFKPTNVILDESGQPRILDFGVARMAYATGYQAGWSSGFNGYTPTYASIRRLKGLNPSKEDDIYALACVVYELLDGRHPYNRRTATEARQEKAKLKRPQGLTRTQWQALAQALSFKDGTEPDLAVLDRAFASTVNRRMAPASWLVGVGLLTTVVLAGELSWVDRWEILSFRVQQNIASLEAHALAQSDATKQKLWASVGPDLMNQLTLQIERYKNSESAADLAVSFGSAKRLAAWGIRDEQLNGHLQWLDHQWVRELYKNYRVLQQPYSTASFVDASQEQALVDALRAVSTLDSQHPLLAQGLWRQSLDERLENSIQRGRWSDALALAEAGKSLIGDEVYQDVAQHLEAMEQAGSDELRWPELSKVEPDLAGSRMISDLIRTGQVVEAEHELHRMLGELDPLARAQAIERFKEVFRAEVELQPVSLAAAAQERGAEFFAELWTKTAVPETSLSEAEHATRRLMDAIERGGDFQLQVNDLADQLQKMTADTEQTARQHLSYRLRQQLAWYVDWPLMHERYRVAASKLFPREDWTKTAVAAGQISCRDVAVSGGRLVNLCRDWLAPYVPGPELVLISDKEVQRAFYMGQREISVADYNTYCRLSQECRVRTAPAELPVTEISSYEAVRYARWLSRVTGQQYRLPTYREWRVTAAQGEADQVCRDEQTLQVAREGSVDERGLMNMATNVREFVTLRRQIYVRGGDVSNRKTPCSMSEAQVHSGMPDQRTGFRLVRELETRS